MDPGVGRGVAQDHPSRVLPVDVADSEGRVVGPDGAGAHEDGVALRPQPVGVGPGRLTRDPPARPVGGRGAPVEGGGQLEDDPRAAGGAVLEVGGELGPDLVRPHADLDVDARRPEGGDPRTAHLGVGVLDGDHHPGHAGADDGVGTRRRAAVVGTRLERRVEGGAGGAGTGRGQGHHLGVGPARRLGGALERCLPTGRLDHRAHPRVGRRRRAHARRQCDGPIHGRLIGGAHSRRVCSCVGYTDTTAHRARRAVTWGAPWVGRRGARGRGGRRRGRPPASRPRRRSSRAC